MATARWRVAASVAVAVGLWPCCLSIGNARTDDWENSLAVDGDWWFDRLRGVSHHYASTIGPLAVRGSKFVALPPVDVFLLLAYSPWHYHCRRAASEFDRLAQALLRAGLAKRIRAATLDCSWEVSRGVCAAFLGEPRNELVVLEAGSNAPQLGRLVYSSLSDLWASADMPMIILGARQDLLSMEGAEGSEMMLRQRLRPGTTAEWMLQWLTVSCSQACEGLPLRDVRLVDERSFLNRLLQLRRHLPVQRTTLQGCVCREDWEHCRPTLWHMLGTGAEECEVFHGCPPKLGFCRTMWPCGVDLVETDRCGPEPGEALLSDGDVATAAGGAGEGNGTHSHEVDVEAGLALWLHDIFERHAFEVPEDDPHQFRRRVLVDFLRTLCSYFPDHLQGREMQHLEMSDGWDPSRSACRESLCELGGLIADDTSWLKHTEEISVMLEVVPETGEGASVGHDDWSPLRQPLAPLPADDAVPPPLYTRLGRVRRFRWRELERQWRLCGRPWPEFAREGFVACQAVDPMAGGLPCGVWQLLHAVTVEVATVKLCGYNRTEDVDACVGPAHNATEESVHAVAAKRRRERQAEEKALREREGKGPTMPKAGSLAPAAEPYGVCLRGRGAGFLLERTWGLNARAVLLLQRARQPAFDTVECRLQRLSIGSATPATGNDTAVEVKFKYGADGGAVVADVLHGPDALQRAQVWKLEAIAGVRLRGLDWRKMLRDAPPDSELLLVGPVPCLIDAAEAHGGEGDAAGDCAEACATFAFVENATAANGSEVDEERGRIHTGVLREQETGQCIGHLMAAPSWPWMQATDRGLALVDCGSAPRYRIELQAAEQNDTFCNTDDAADCLKIFRRPRLPHKKWEAVKRIPMVPAEVEPASTVIKRFRRMVALFWRCSECRRRFLSIDFDAGRDAQTPRDGVLWLWRAHNTINSQLTTSSRFAKDYPSDLGLGKEPWPLRSLCPRCWRPPVGKGGADEFDEDEVYHFLAARFYASRAATPRPRANAKRNVSSAGPLEDAVLAAAAVDVAGGGVAGSEELHPRRARRLAAIAAIAAVTASAVWALSLRPAASAPPPPAVPAVRRPRRATSAGYARLPTAEDDPWEWCVGPCTCTPLL